MSNQIQEQQIAELWYHFEKTQDFEKIIFSDIDRVCKDLKIPKKDWEIFKSKLLEENVLNELEYRGKYYYFFKVPPLDDSHQFLVLKVKNKKNPLELKKIVIGSMVMADIIESIREKEGE